MGHLDHGIHALNSGKYSGVTSLISLCLFAPSPPSFLSLLSFFPPSLHSFFMFSFPGSPIHWMFDFQMEAVTCCFLFYFTLLTLVFSYETSSTFYPILLSFKFLLSYFYFQILSYCLNVPFSWLLLTLKVSSPSPSLPQPLPSLSFAPSIMSVSPQVFLCFLPLVPCLSCRFCSEI